MRRDRALVSALPLANLPARSDFRNGLDDYANDRVASAVEAAIQSVLNANPNQTVVIQHLTINVAIGGGATIAGGSVTRS
jgi:hypothetical protein